MTLGTRLKQLFQFGTRFYWCVYYAVILCSFVLFASEERHEALICLVCKTKCYTTDKKQAIMVLWLLKHSGQVTISCSVPRFIGTCSGKRSTIMGCIITNSMHSVANITHVYRAELELCLAPRPLSNFSVAKILTFRRTVPTTLFCILSTLCICRVCKILVTGSITYPKSVKSWSF